MMGPSRGFLQLVLVLAMLLLVGTVRAQLEPDDNYYFEGLDASQPGESRHYNFNIGGDNVEISAVSDQDGDNLHFNVHTSTGGPVVVAEQRGALQVPRIKLTLKRIVEFEPDEVAGYQLDGGDLPVKYYGVNNGSGAWQFDSFIDENSASSIDRRFHAVSTDKAITLSYRANPTPTYITNNFTIGLNDIKFDLAIDFDQLRRLGFLQSNDTHLSIVGVIQSRWSGRSCENASTSGAACLNQVDGTLAGFVRWVNKLECPNGDLALTASQFLLDSNETDNDDLRDGELATAVAWTIHEPYRGRGVCVWDPVVRFEHSGASTLTFISSNFVITLLLSLVIALIV